MDNTSLSTELLEFKRKVAIQHLFRNKQDRTFRRLRAPREQPFNAPEGTLTVEQSQRLNNFTDSLIHVYDELLPTRVFCKRNLSVGLRAALDKLRNDKSIVIKPADKNLGITIMDSEWYHAEVMKHLTNELVYDRLDEDEEWLKQVVLDGLTVVVEREMPKHAKPSLDFFRPDREYILHLTAAKARIPYFYLIPKVHKPKLAGRPIVASTQWITTPAAKWVDEKLQPIVRKQWTYIENSTAVINDLESLVLDNTQPIYLVTADVESLYTNIPTDRGLAAVKQALDSYGDYSAQMKSAILALCEFVLRNNYMQFEGRYYRQLQGTAMGSNLAPPYANIYVFQATEKVLAKRKSILYWKRHIDDVFMISTMPAPQLRAHFTLMGTTSQLNFTPDIQEEAVDFLDLHIYKGERYRASGILDLTVHQKVMNTYLYLPFQSYHPTFMKKSFVKGELIRYVRLCSNAREFLNIRQLFWDRLRARGYPRSFLRPIFTTVDYAKRSEYLQPKEKRDKVKAPVSLRIPMNPAYDNISYRAASLTLTDFAQITISRTKAPTLRDLLVKARFP